MKETQEGGPGRSLCVYKVQRERRTRPDDVQAVLSEKELPAVYERMWNLRVTVDTRPDVQAMPSEPSISWTRMKIATSNIVCVGSASS